jgi:hypothetical protein
MTTGDRYPGQSAIVPEMLSAWKDRNIYRRAYHTVGEARNWASMEAEKRHLKALRRVWHALRKAGRT